MKNGVWGQILTDIPADLYFLVFTHIRFLILRFLVLFFIIPCNITLVMLY